MSAMIAWDWLVEVIKSIGPYKPIVLLCVKPLPGKVSVSQAGRKFIEGYGDRRRCPNVPFPTIVVGGPPDGLSRNFGLINGGHWLRMPG
jgi:hypothetical protein